MRYLLAVALLISTALIWAERASIAAPDVIFHGGRIHTADVGAPSLGGVAVRNGAIEAVGTAAEVLALAGPETTVVDLAGRMLLPGFHDVHVHAVEAGINADLCYFPANRSLAVYERLARECAAASPDAPWVLGAGVFAAGLLEGAELPIEVLDRAVPDRPTLILDDLGHGAWANTRAMQAAGYSPGSDDPPGGILHRDSRTDALSGVVFENAQQRLRDAAWPPGRATRQLAYASLLESLGEFARNGITSVSDAGGYWTRAHHTAWKKARRRGRLTVRASNALYVYPDRDRAAQLKKLRRLFSNRAGSLLRFNSAKVYVDGILDLGTSLLTEPYQRSPAGLDVPARGFEYFAGDALDAYTAALVDIGFGIHFHATGDGGVRRALDALQALQARRQVDGGAHRVTHLYLVADEDRSRFAELGVVADLQLAPDAIAPSYARYLERFIGRSRAAQLLPVDALLGADATTVLSSDWDAGPLSPLGTIERALTRRDQPVRSLEDALRMLTLDAARALGQEAITGSIEVGKQADLVVLDRDLFREAPARISRASVLVTMLAGDVVFGTLADLPAAQSSRNASIGSTAAAR